MATPCCSRRATMGFELWGRFAIITQSTYKCFFPHSLVFMLFPGRYRCRFLGFVSAGRRGVLVVLRCFQLSFWNRVNLVCTAFLSWSKWQILYDCVQVEFNSLGPKVFLGLCIVKSTMAPLYRLWQVGNTCNSKRKWQQMVLFLMRQEVMK